MNNFILRSIWICVWIIFGSFRSHGARWTTNIPNSAPSRELRPNQRLVETYHMSESVKNKILETHNEARSNVQPSSSNIKRMSWDQDLEELATNFSKLCAFGHNQAKQLPRYWRIGENMYVSQNIAFNSSYVSNAVQVWDNEKRFYTYSSSTCQSGKSCSSYTQLVWADTFKVGCGASICSTVNVRGVEWSKSIVFVCNYGPGGNWITGFPYKHGVSCSDCHWNDTCRDNLCSNKFRDAPASQIAPVWSEWTSWTQCSRSCGFGGTRYRTRFCTTFINRDCGGPSRNTQFFCARPCYSRPPNTVSRPSWNIWGRWSSCSKSCGEGKRKRQRSCSTGRLKNCSGFSSQTIPCNKAPCAKWSTWGSWTECSKTCGRGNKSRRRVCSGVNRKACTGNSDERKDCNAISCEPTWMKWGDWSSCTKACGTGSRFRTRSCSSAHAPDCCGISHEEEPCKKKKCSS